MEQHLLTNVIKVSSAMEDLIDLSLLMKFLGLIAPSVDTVLLE
jgi:hypothetical protein